MANRATRSMLSAGLAVALAVGTLAACSSGGSGGAGNDKTSGASSGSGTLTYWSMWNKTEPQAQVLQTAFDAFEKSTGIHVDVKWVGRDVLTNVSAALTSGKLPDLVDQGGDELTATFSAANSAMGLQDVCDAQVTGESIKICGGAIPQDFVTQYKTQDGQPLLIPYELITSSIWYNANQFPDFATNPPKTWDDFVQLLNKEKAAGRHPLALDGDTPEYAAYFWEWAAARDAGPQAFYNAVSDKTGAAWDNPDLLTAAKQVESLVSSRFFTPDYAGTKWPAQQTAWANGQSKSDFLLLGSWAPSETAPFAEKNPDKWTYASFPWPQGTNAQGNDSTELYLIGFAIPKKAQNADNAKKFIEFFLNKQYLSGISTKALNLTPRADIEVPTQLEGVKKQIESAKTYFKLYDGVTGEFPQFGTESFLPQVQNLLLGKQTADGFIKAMKQATIEYWKSH